MVGLMPRGRVCIGGFGGLWISDLGVIFVGLGRGRGRIEGVVEGEKGGA